MLSRGNGLHTVIAAWRSPERLAASPDWRVGALRLVDVQVFGETGLIASRRPSDGRLGPVLLGPVMAPRGVPGGAVVAELARTEAGSLALRGPMVSRFPYPPGAERSGGPCLKLDRDGYVDTGYACRVDRDNGAVTVTGSPPGLVSIGGCRFALGELHRLVETVDAAGTLAALPDLLIGQRLAGHAQDCDAVRQGLADVGANPLLVGAFRDRRPERPAAA